LPKNKFKSSTLMEHFTGTKAMASSHAFDTQALATYLRRAMPGFEGPLSVEQFKGGQSNPTYKLVTPTQRYVMRSKPGPAAKLLPSAHAVDREFKVMRALASTDVPVPQMHVLCEDESVIGRAFYVMQFMDGRVLWDQALPALSRTERGAVYAEMNRVIAALHSVDVAAVGLADYGKAGNYFERQIGRWSKQYLASITEPNKAMDALIEWLPQHIPTQALDSSLTSVVHGDFRLDNLMFHPSEPRAIAVLDWELSTLGHPLADFSYHCMAWHIPPGVFRGIAGLDHAALGIPDEADYIQLYCQRRSLAGGTALQADVLQADWNFYLAYNLFRLASILQGIAKRVLDGTASSAQAQSSGASAATLAKLAWGYAQKHVKQKA
jgi:aminoglycoside phosphotransferase (APT) family kinase protein